MRISREKVQELWLSGKTSGQIAHELGHDPSGICKVLQHLPDYTPVRDARRVWDKAWDGELQELYVSQGWGYRRCASYFGVSERVVAYAVRRLGITDLTRIPTKRHCNQHSRDHARKLFLFSQQVKSKRYLLEGGVCKECRESVSPGEAVYHHIIPIDRGGDGSLQNCMLLHGKCHIACFDKLHNGRTWEHFLSSITAPTVVCGECGRRTTRDGLCGVCSSRRRCPECGGDISYRRALLGRTCNVCSPPVCRTMFSDATLLNDLKTDISVSELARRYGCSHQAVFKRIKKLKASGALREGAGLQPQPDKH